jgi:hypothetical protein
MKFIPLCSMAHPSVMSVPWKRAGFPFLKTPKETSWPGCPDGRFLGGAHTSSIRIGARSGSSSPCCSRGCQAGALIADFPARLVSRPSTTSQSGCTRKAWSREMILWGHDLQSRGSGHWLTFRGWKKGLGLFLVIQKIEGRARRRLTDPIFR